MKLWKRVTSYCHRRIRHAHITEVPLWFLAPLVAACWLIKRGVPVLAASNAVLFASAARGGHFTSGMAVVALVASGGYAFITWYHAEIYRKYAPGVKKRLIP